MAFKGTVSVVLSKPPCTNGNARFTMPLKALSDQEWIIENWLFSINFKSELCISTAGKHTGTIWIQHF